MKKILLAALAVFGMTRIAEAAPIWGTVQIGTSTALTPTLQNGAINISSGNVRTITASTATITRATIAQSTTTNATITNLNVTGTFTPANFTVAVATITNLTSTNFNASTGSAANWVTTQSTTTTHTFTNQNGTNQSVTNSTTTNLTSTNIQVSTINFTNVLQVNGATGTSGQILVSNGNKLPTWTNAGRLLQAPVKCTVTSSSATASTSAFVPSNLTCAITPVSATSTILVMANGTLASPSANNAALASIFRNTSNIQDATLGGCYVSAPTVVINSPCSLITTDSPATTSSTSYTIYIKAGSGTITYGQGETRTMLLFEIGI